MMYVIGAMVFLGTARYFVAIFTSRWTWAVIVICASIIFTSGIMFVRIRGTPFVAHSRKGEPTWMAAGYQNQYGMEVPVIGGICKLPSQSAVIPLYSLFMADFMASFAYTALIFLVPRISSPSKQRLGTYIWCGLIVMLLSILLAFFRVKNPCKPKLRLALRRLTRLARQRIHSVYSCNYLHVLYIEKLLAQRTDGC